MRRRYSKPFGCELRGGMAHFQLWAPAVEKLRLRITEPKAAEYTMNACTGGWHRLSLPNTDPGSLYLFVLADGLAVPDPASRFNPQDVHGPSEVIEPLAFDWPDDVWRGRPWEEAVIYEIHIGTFSAEGTFRGAESHLDHLAGLGVTAIEIMPVADFPGRRNWGYDGVLPYAPDSSYG